MRLGVSGYTVTWTFTDAGERGTSDRATIRITNGAGAGVLEVGGLLDKGNQPTHRARGPVASAVAQLRITGEANCAKARVVGGAVRRESRLSSARTAGVRWRA